MVRDMVDKPPYQRAAAVSSKPPYQQQERKKTMARHEVVIHENTSVTAGGSELYPITFCISASRT